MNVVDFEHCVAYAVENNVCAVCSLLLVRIRSKNWGIHKPCWFIQVLLNFSHYFTVGYFSRHDQGVQSVPNRHTWYFLLVVADMKLVQTSLLGLVPDRYRSILVVFDLGVGLLTRRHGYIGCNTMDISYVKHGKKLKKKKSYLSSAATLKFD